MSQKLVSLIRQILYPWQRSLIAGICVLIVLARIVFPNLRVDWVSVVLLGIAMLAFLVPRFTDLRPHLIRVLPYIKKAKLAGLEVELSDEIRKLGSEVDLAKEAVEAEANVRLESDFAQSQSEVLQQLKSDPRAALLLLAAKIEQQVMLRLGKHGFVPRRVTIPLHGAISLGIDHGLFPKEVLAPFRQFWSIRNQIVHGMAFEVDSSLIMSLISIGLEILRLVSVEEGDGPHSTK